MTSSRLTVGIGIAVTLCLFVFFLINTHYASIRTKLFDCTNATLRAWVKLDGVKVSHLILALPKQGYGTKELPPTFAGMAVVKTHGTSGATVPIASESVEPCNWLDSEGFQGYLIAWKDVQAGQVLRSTLKGRGTYEVEVSFSVPPPRDSSVWISCVSKPQWPWQRRVVVLNPEK